MRRRGLFFDTKCWRTHFEQRKLGKGFGNFGNAATERRWDILKKIVIIYETLGGILRRGMAWHSNAKAFKRSNRSQENLGQDLWPSTAFNPFPLISTQCALEYLQVGVWLHLIKSHILITYLDLEPHDIDSVSLLIDRAPVPAARPRKLHFEGFVGRIKIHILWVLRENTRTTQQLFWILGYQGQSTKLDLLSVLQLHFAFYL